MKKDQQQKPAKNVDEYLAAAPEEVRPVLETLRVTIRPLFKYLLSVGMHVPLYCIQYICSLHSGKSKYLKFLMSAQDICAIIPTLMAGMSPQDRFPEAVVWLFPLIGHED